MMSTGKLTGKTLFITGASRGIGKTIALKDGAKVVSVKTADPHPELSGTFYSPNKEIGVREDKKVQNVLNKTAKRFGNVDFLVNNVNALSLTETLKTSVKGDNPMNQKTFVTSKTCSPHLKKSLNPYITNLSPQLTMNAIRYHSAYSISKRGMSTSTLSMAEEFKSCGFGADALWTKTNKASVIFKKYGQVETIGQKRMMSSQAGDGGIEGIFTSIKEKLNADIVKSTQAVYQFNLTGDKEETYHIDLKNGEGTAGKGKPSDTPDATLTMNPDNFQKLFAGKLKATSAFMTGKLKISGNMQKAMKLEKLLTSLKK